MDWGIVPLLFAISMQAFIVPSYLAQSHIKVQGQGFNYHVIELVSCPKMPQQQKNTESGAETKLKIHAAENSFTH